MSKKVKRNKNGHSYLWSEGAIPFPDDINQPSRTIITSEGGKSASRIRHAIQLPNKRFRRLVPIEIERLSMFPKNFTKVDGVSVNKRVYLIGNALVVGIVEKIGNSLSRFLVKS